MVKNEGRKKKILVVDDEENLRHMLQVMLRKHGYLVDTAADGNEALGKASGNDYDFILCDIRMPVLDGSGFLEKAVAAGIEAHDNHDVRLRHHGHGHRVHEAGGL